MPRFQRAEDDASIEKRRPAAAPKGVKALLVLTKLAQAEQQLDSLTPGGIVRGMALFERIVAGNPEHAPAYAGHATASMAMAIFYYEPSRTAMPRARASVQRALEVDPACAEAHAALGALRALHDFDLTGANAAFLMAARLKPESAGILQARAAFYLAPLGLLEEAADEVRYAFSRVGVNPVALAFDGSNMWIACPGSPHVVKFRVADASVQARVVTGNRPWKLAFDGDYVWVADSGGRVSKLRAGDAAIVGTFTAGNNPSSIAFDGANIWMANYNSGTLNKL